MYISNITFSARQRDVLSTDKRFIRGGKMADAGGRRTEKSDYIRRVDTGNYRCKYCGAELYKGIVPYGCADY